MTMSHPGSPTHSHSRPPALDALEAATSRYLEALTVLDDDDMRAPSLLPGWSRGHVVTHLARNADAMVNALTGARLGEVRAMYLSQEQRNADIDSGASRSAQELCSEAEQTASAVLEMRLLEVEVHHADLGVGYTWQDWDRAFADAVISRAKGERSEEPSAVLRSTDTGGLWKIGPGEGPEVRGPAGALAWWLLGRGDGAGLVSSAGTVPALGRWR